MAYNHTNLATLHGITRVGDRSAQTSSLVLTLLLVRRGTLAVEDMSNGSFWEGRCKRGQSQVTSAFHERYGKPSPLKAAAHVSMGETRLVRNVSFGSQWSTNTLNGDMPPILPFPLGNRHANSRRNNQWNSMYPFDYVWPHEGQGDDVISASVYKRTQRSRHETSRSTCCAFATISDSLVRRVSSLSRRVCSLPHLHKWKKVSVHRKFSFHDWTRRPPSIRHHYGQTYYLRATIWRGKYLDGTGGWLCACAIPWTAQ